MSSSISRKAGGLQTSVRRLVQSVDSPNTDRKSVFALTDEYTHTDLDAWWPLAVETFPVMGPIAFGYAPQLAHRLMDCNSDLVHVHGLWMYPSVAVLCWHERTRRPYIVHPHGMLDRWAVRNSRWKKRIAGILYANTGLRRAACIRALCASEANAIRSYGLPNPICIIPNGIDLPDHEATTVPQWRNCIPNDHKVLLYLGRLHPKKGLHHLLEAWSMRNTGRDEWTLVIAGWGEREYESALKKQAANLGLDETVKFIGPQFGEDKASAYQNAAAFILPSFSEGLPLVILEAWAYKLPVVMTEQCNLPEGFQAGAAVRIETTPEAIAIGLEQLFSLTDAERTQIGEHGRKLVSKHFAWSGIGADMFAVQQWIVGGGEAPNCVRMD